MRRLRDWLGSLGRRPRLLACAVLLLVAAAAFPFARDWHHWRAGGAALDRHRPAEARAHLEAYLRARPDSVPAHLLAGRAARQAGDLAAAEGHVRECQRLLGGSSPETTLEWSLLAACAGDVDEVEGFLQEQARRGAAPAPLVWEALAEGYLRVYRVRDALACLDAWLAREPDNTRALSLRGDAWREVQAWSKAVPDYQRAAEVDPDRDDARWWLAVSLEELGRHEEALRHLEILRPKRPEDVEVTVQIARCCKGLLRLEEARQLLEAATAGHPDHALALRTRGEVELAGGNPGAAEPWLRRAARAAPNDYRAQYALAQFLQSRRGREAEAAPEQRRAEKLKERLERLADLGHRRMSATPHDPALRAELGALLLELGEKDAGRRWLQSALRLDPACRAAHAALAGYYRERGDAGQADFHARAAVSGAASAASGSSRP
jgi:tetratricopeptide (TPR) repeat protein